MLFELRLGLLVLGFTAGVTCALLGLRAVFLLQLHPLVLLLPGGTLLSFWFGRAAASLYRTFRSRLFSSDRENQA